nr:hypothetical protein [Nonlabens ulvanivorans]
MKKIVIALSLICCLIFNATAQEVDQELNLDYEGVTLLDFKVETVDQSNDFDALYISIERWLSSILEQSLVRYV